MVVAAAETGPTADDQPAGDEGAPGSVKGSETAASVEQPPAAVASAASVTMPEDDTRPASTTAADEDAESGAAKSDADIEEELVGIKRMLICLKD